MRIDKLLSNLKYGSRSDIKKFCKKGLVKVNGNVIKNSDFKVDTSIDKVFIDNEEVFFLDELTLMMNKPKGYVSANQDMDHETVFDLLHVDYLRFDLNIAGRLDKDTTGFLLLTTNGKLIHNIIKPSKDIYKKYLVTVDKKISNNINKLKSGVTILDGKDQEYTTSEAIIERIDEFNTYISIKEGKFHQVKRMFKHIGYNVVELKRVAIGGLELIEELEPGEVFELTEEEINKIFN